MRKHFPYKHSYQREHQDRWYLNEQSSDHRPHLNDREHDNSIWPTVHEHPHSRRRVYPYEFEYRREHELNRTPEYRHHAGDLYRQEERLTNRFRETENHSRSFSYDSQRFYQSCSKEYSEINQERNCQARPYEDRRDTEWYTYRESVPHNREWSCSKSDYRETWLRAQSSDDLDRVDRRCGEGARHKGWIDRRKHIKQGFKDNGKQAGRRNVSVKDEQTRNVPHVMRTVRNDNIASFTESERSYPLPVYLTETNHQKTSKILNSVQTTYIKDRPTVSKFLEDDKSKSNKKVRSDTHDTTVLKTGIVENKDKNNSTIDSGKDKQKRKDINSSSKSRSKSLDVSSTDKGKPANLKEYEKKQRKTNVTTSNKLKQRKSIDVSTSQKNCTITYTDKVKKENNKHSQSGTVRINFEGVHANKSKNIHEKGNSLNHQTTGPCYVSPNTDKNDVSACNKTVEKVAYEINSTKIVDCSLALKTAEESSTYLVSIEEQIKRQSSYKEEKKNEKTCNHRRQMYQSHTHNKSKKKLLHTFGIRHVNRSGKYLYWKKYKLKFPHLHLYKMSQKEIMSYTRGRKRKRKSVGKSNMTMLSRITLLESTSSESDISLLTKPCTTSSSKNLNDISDIHTDDDMIISSENEKNFTKRAEKNEETSCLKEKTSVSAVGTNVLEDSQTSLHDQDYMKLVKTTNAKGIICEDTYNEASSSTKHVEVKVSTHHKPGEHFYNLPSIESVSESDNDIETKTFGSSSESDTILLAGTHKVGGDGLGNGNSKRRCEMEAHDLGNVFEAFSDAETQDPSILEISSDINLANWDERVLPNGSDYEQKVDAENTEHSSSVVTSNYFVVFSDAETQDPSELHNVPAIDHHVQFPDMPVPKLLNAGEVKEKEKEFESYSSSDSLPVIRFTGRKRHRNEKPDKYCDTQGRKQESNNQKKIKCTVVSETDDNNTDGEDGDIEDNSDAEDNNLKCSSPDLFSDSEEILFKRLSHINNNGTSKNVKFSTNTEVWDFGAATKDSEIETLKNEIKLEPDPLFNGYTQEPDVVWVSDDEDNTIIMSFSQPVINLHGSAAIKSEQNDSDYDLFGPKSGSDSDFDHETILGSLLNAKSPIDADKKSAVPFKGNRVMGIVGSEDVEDSCDEDFGSGDDTLLSIDETNLYQTGARKAVSTNMLVHTDSLSDEHFSDNDIIPIFLDHDQYELNTDTDSELDFVMSNHEVKMPIEKVKDKYFVEAEAASPVTDVYMQETQKLGELDQADEVTKKYYELTQLSQRSGELTRKDDELTQKDDGVSQNDDDIEGPSVFEFHSEHFPSESEQASDKNEGLEKKMTDSKTAAINARFGVKAKTKVADSDEELCSLIVKPIKKMKLSPYQVATQTADNVELIDSDGLNSTIDLIDDSGDDDLLSMDYVYHLDKNSKDKKDIEVKTESEDDDHNTVDAYQAKTQTTGKYFGRKEKRSTTIECYDTLTQVPDQADIDTFEHNDDVNLGLYETMTQVENPAKITLKYKEETNKNIVASTSNTFDNYDALTQAVTSGCETENEEEDPYMVATQVDDDFYEQPTQIHDVSISNDSSTDAELAIGYMGATQVDWAIDEDGDDELLAAHVEGISQTNKPVKTNADSDDKQYDIMEYDTNLDHLTEKDTAEIGRKEKSLELVKKVKMADGAKNIFKSILKKRDTLSGKDGTHLDQVKEKGITAEKISKEKFIELAKKLAKAEWAKNTFKNILKKRDTTSGLGSVTGAGGKGILKKITATGSTTASPVKRVQLNIESTDTKTTDKKHATGGKNTGITSSALSTFDLCGPKSDSYSDFDHEPNLDTEHIDDVNLDRYETMAQVKNPAEKKIKNKDEKHKNDNSLDPKTEMDTAEKVRKEKSLELSKKQKMADVAENDLKKILKKADTTSVPASSGGVTRARGKGILKNFTTTGSITVSPVKRTKLTIETTDTKTTDEKHGGKSTGITRSALSMSVKSTLGGSSSSRTQKEFKDDLLLTELTVKDNWLSKKTLGNVRNRVKTGQFHQKRGSRARASKRPSLEEALPSRVLEAKYQLQERAFKNIVRPGDTVQGIRKAKSNVSVASANTEDVELPTGSQMVRLGLPLLNDLGPVVTKKKIATSSSTHMFSSISSSDKKTKEQITGTPSFPEQSSASEASMLNFAKALPVSTSSTACPTDKVTVTTSASSSTTSKTAPSSLSTSLSSSSSSSTTTTAAASATTAESVKSFQHGSKEGIFSVLNSVLDNPWPLSVDRSVPKPKTAASLVTSQAASIEQIATKALTTTSIITAKSVYTSANKPADTGKTKNLMNKFRDRQMWIADGQRQVETHKPIMNKISSYGRLPLQQVQMQQSGHPLAKLPAPPRVFPPPVAKTDAEPFPATLIDKPKVIVWEEFLKVILKWSPKWLNEAGQEKNKGQPPPVTVDWLGQPKPQIFSLIERYFSYEEYSAKFMLPLLLYETWEGCLREYLLKREKRKLVTYHVMINSIEAPLELLQSFSMLGFTSRAARSKGEVISRSDLAWLSLSVKLPKNSTSTVQEVMGVVEKVNYIEDSAVIESLSKQHEHLAAARSGDTIVQAISIRVRNRKLAPVKTDLHHLRVVSSLVTTERAVQALRKLPENPLWKHLLFPTCNRTYFHQNRPGAATLKEPYNPSQLQAIYTARCMLREGGTKPQLSLIQGPPGTGKSHTIIGIIKSIIKDLKGHVRICLCTPSNAAVDELVRRLAKSNKNRVTDDQVKVIRLGRKSTLPADLQTTFLETAVKQVWLEENIPASLRRELESLDKKIQISKYKKETTTDKNQKAKFTADIQKIEKQKEVIKKQLREPAGLATNMRYCLKALEQAHVVAGTLSSMADHNIRQLYRELTSAKKGPLFHCVIIDEATQGIEMDTLIPLQYGTPKLIMVGDPEQLAPTVLSQKCQECRFNLSLFERLDSYFRTSATQSPVLLLDTQYRMHPEIALHPNQYSYEGRIQNDSSLYIRPKHPLVPYLVFNIEGTQLFSQTSKSLSNPEEAIFTATLCEFVIKHGKVRPSAIGIIAPYSNQKMDINRELSKRRLDQVEVSTVDGFQGQEREVIIMSCVRSREGVGFVGNRNRITVAITRAKHAMYIIGNLDCLKVNIEWRALIENAEMRNVVVPVTERTWQSALEKCLNK